MEARPIRIEDFYWSSDNQLTIALNSSAINQFTGAQAKAPSPD